MQAMDSLCVGLERGSAGGVEEDRPERPGTLGGKTEGGLLMGGSGGGA